MDNKKFEQLIDLIINENEEQARELFHEIVVEKSREIYENIMMDEMMSDGMDEGMGGQVGDLLDEINAEESGMTEGEDDEVDMDLGDEEEIVDIEAGDDAEEGGEVEDAVVRIEDKLDQLMAEFEEIMAGDSDMGDEEGEEDFGDEEGEEDFGDEEEGEEMMEAVQLQKVSVTHGDNGANTKSPSLHDPKVKAAGVNPVKFSGAAEAVPTSPKGPSNAYSKGETQVKGAGSFKNAPGAGNFSEKGESAPKPVTKDEAGKAKSPVAESRTVTKRIIK